MVITMLSLGNCGQTLYLYKIGKQRKPCETCGKQQTAPKMFQIVANEKGYIILKSKDCESSPRIEHICKINYLNV